MKSISLQRYNAIAGYARHPLASTFGTEIAWFESACQRCVATLVIDTDSEFSVAISAQDLNERFRCVKVTEFSNTPTQALEKMATAVSDILSDLDKSRQQGDESKRATDFFKSVVRTNKQSASFRGVSTDAKFAPARTLISYMMRWYEDVDGNFVEQFQTSGFDARLWELYIFATLLEAGLEVRQPKPAPDFIATSAHGELAIEATTINPSTSGAGAELFGFTESTDKRTQIIDYLAIRFAGRLLAKLAERYWARPSVAGRPLLIAIQDFHAPLSMTYSEPALSTFLYGWTTNPIIEPAGEATSKPTRVRNHIWGNKVVDSGFFQYPESENISAVLFNASGTVNKFNRIGRGAGFGDPRIAIIRFGRFWNPNPESLEPLSYAHSVTEGYVETWAEGLSVYHNPNALRPLDPGLLRGATHHFSQADGTIETVFPTSWNPFDSKTLYVPLPD